MSLFCAIDLHSNNSVLVVINDQDNVDFKQRLPNDIHLVEGALEPFRDELHGFAVESTFNWYWLVDGLQAAKQYQGRAANTPMMCPMPAGWPTDAVGHSTHWYIYPYEQRTLRDLLRKRLMLTGECAMHRISTQSQIWHSTGERIDCSEIKA